MTDADPVPNAFVHLTVIVTGVPTGIGITLDDWLVLEIVTPGGE
jgi:hypothetical protein